MASPHRYHHWLEAARKVQQEVDETGVGRPSSKLLHPKDNKRTILERFDEVVTSKALRSTSRGLLSDGHYARAVEEAFKCLNNTVKEKSRLSDKDGSELMFAAFNDNSPVLKLNALDSESDKSEQIGYRHIYAGAMTGIRNPRAHEHQLKDDPEVALELLVLANHLMRKLDSATTNGPASQESSP